MALATARGSKGLRSSTFSPTPMAWIGSPNFSAAATSTPPRAVPSSLVMGSDGTEGCRLLKRCGAIVLAQDKESCVVFGMPSTVIAEGLADRIVSLEQIASEMTALVQNSSSLANQGAR